MAQSGVSLDPGEHFAPIEAGHQHIQQEHIELGLPHAIESFDAILNGGDDAARFFEPALEELAVGFITTTSTTSTQS